MHPQHPLFPLFGLSGLPWPCPGGPECGPPRPPLCDPGIL